VSCIPPLKEGDEKYALSFVVPVSADGLKLYCRYPFSIGKPSVFDYPFSTMFDETDAFVVFDDVFIPWEHVFVYKDIKGTQAQFFETAAHVLGNNQAQIRLSIKLKFMAGLALRIAQMNGIDKIPSVIEKLGEVGTIASIVEALVLASEYNGKIRPIDVYSPNPRFLYGAMGLQADFYSKVIHILRDLSGAGVLQLPSSYMDLISDETKSDIEKYITSPGFGSDARIKLFKLAWDVIGSEFGGRHYQYEMFYAGAPYVAKTYAYRNYGFEEGSEILDNILNSYSLPDQRGRVS
ncbi:MAG: 4-hydroxyphenylacetate 3-hydroxylase C-terminal domain-containing protein, partial [Thermoplasmataceae archaeon]